MKFTPAALVCATVLLTSSAASAQSFLKRTGGINKRTLLSQDNVDTKAEEDFGKDDADYWSRYLTLSMSAPTGTPTPVPEPVPTVAPTTPAPTNICNVEVSVGCQQGSTDCADIVPPSATCSNDDQLRRLTLSYNGATSCDNSQNSQFDSSCTNVDSVAEVPMDEVRVECTSGESVFCNCTVQLGATTTLGGGANQALLPADMVCKISSMDYELCQTVTFDASGSAPLNLKDSFGKLTVEGCEDEDGSLESDCLVDVKYSYLVNNTGATNLTVTSLERSCDGDVLDLLQDAGAPDPFVFSSGSDVTITENRNLDVCLSTCVTKSLTAKGISDDGVTCDATEVLDFCVPPIPAPAQCDIDTSMSCVYGPDNNDCSESVPPSATCSNDDQLRRLTLSYNGATTCDNSQNSQSNSSCTNVDSVAEVPMNEVRVECTSGESVFCNCTVQLGATTTLGGGANQALLPADMVCKISSMDYELCQTVTFDASGSAPLNLKDSFGKLTVEGCEDEDGSLESNCLVDAKLFYNLTAAALPINVTSYVRTIENTGSSFDILATILADQEPPLEIEANGGGVAQETYTIDQCAGFCLKQSSKLTGAQEEGVACERTATLDYCVAGFP